jgi:hypothetical protein
VNAEEIIDCQHRVSAAGSQSAIGGSMLQLACLAVLLLVQLPQQHMAQAADLPTQAAKPSIIAVGDGLTEGAFARKHDGWGVLLQERYVRKVRNMQGPGGLCAQPGCQFRLCASLSRTSIFDDGLLAAAAAHCFLSFSTQ